MLQEIFLTQTQSSEGYKRWFQDDYFDLFIWQDFYSSDIVSFQLCYDRACRERVIGWHQDYGFEHFRVDDGEQTPYKNMTPVFVNENMFPYREVLQNFIDRSEYLDEYIRIFIIEKLQEWYGKASSN